MPFALAVVFLCVAVVLLTGERPVPGAELNVSMVQGNILPPTVRDKSRAAAKRIRRFVQEEIVAGRLRPGDKVPTERELALRFDAGRNTVRRTLVALEAEGRILRHVGRGTFVLPDTRASPPAQADRTLAAASVARAASPSDMMELRIAFEPDITVLAVQRSTPAEIDRMHGFVEVSRTVATLQEFEDLDDALHRTIAVATRNPLAVAVAEMITAVRNEAEWSAVKKRTLTDAFRDLHTGEHVAIVDAIRQRDAKGAREAMLGHLLNVQRMMFKL